MDSWMQVALFIVIWDNDIATYAAVDRTAMAATIQ